jgi:hypothetical protein
MKLTESIICPDDDEREVYHIPDEAGSDTTLCGLSDVRYESHDASTTGITCKACLRIWKWCKNLSIPNASLKLAGKKGGNHGND